MISKKGLLKFVKYTLIFMNAFGFILSIFLGLFGIAYPDKHFPLSYKGREMALCSLFCMLVTTIGYCGAHNHRRILLIIYGATNVIIVIIVIVLWLLFRENSILGNKEINNMFITTLAITIAVMFLFSFILAFHIQTFKTNVNDSIVSQSHQLLLQTTALLQQQQQQQQQQHHNNQQHHQNRQHQIQHHQLTAMSNNSHNTTTMQHHHQQQQQQQQHHHQQQSILNDPPMGTGNHMQQQLHNNQAPQQNQLTATSHPPSNANVAYLSNNQDLNQPLPRSHHHNNINQQQQHPPPQPPLGPVMGRGIQPTHSQLQNPYDLGSAMPMAMIHGGPPHLGPADMVSPTPFQVPTANVNSAAIRHQMMPPAPPPPATAATIKMSSNNQSGHSRTRSQASNNQNNNCDDNNTTPRSRGESSSQRVTKSQGLTSAGVGGGANQAHYSTSSASSQKHPGSATMLHQTHSLRDPHQRQHSSARHHDQNRQQQVVAGSAGMPQHQHQHQDQPCPVLYCTFQPCDGTV